MFSTLIKTKILAVIGGIIFLIPILAFDVSAQDMDIKKIKNSNNYYTGEACTPNSEEAGDIALQKLTESIAVRVTSDFQNKIKEEMSNDSSEVKETTTQILNTYSSVTLKNVQTIRNSEECGVRVFHYIPKSEVSKIYAERKQLIRDLFRRASDAEKEGNYVTSLKLYYYSIVLMRSLPDQTIYFGSDNLVSEIPSRIRDIINNVEFTVKDDRMISEKEREITLNVKVNNKAAQTLDFKFWDGNKQVYVQAADGEATLRLYGSSTEFESLDAKVKYSYYKQRGDIKQVKKLWNIVDKPSFSRMIKIDLKQTKQEKSKEPVTSADQDKIKLNAADSIQKTKSFKQKGENLTSWFKNSSSDSLEKLPSQWAKDDFLNTRLTKLEELNNIKIRGNKTEASLNKTYEGYEIRQIPSLVSFPTLNTQSSEYLIYDYNSEGNLSTVNFGIMKNLYEKFQKQAEYGDDWKERQVIIKFVEKYRTAFLTRDMKKIKKMFADQAIIIVGREVQTENKNKNKYEYQKVSDKQPDYEYIEMTKEEYLKRQSRLFEKEEDIFLDFSSFNIIRKNNQKGVYGISLRQNYMSTNYSDEGYLFLLVDFNESQPKIYVRSWQPQKWSKEELVDLANFNVNF